MYLPQERVQEQWRTYLPFLYKFYMEHVQKNFVDVIGAKWFKQSRSPFHKPNILPFIIAGISMVQHSNQQYSYTIQENLVKSFQLILPQNAIQSEHTQSKRSNQSLIPYVVEKIKIFYERQITCLQDIIITQRNISQNFDQSHFYALGIKNDSIRLLSAQKLAGFDSKKRNHFFNQKFPFYVKNIKETNLCTGNQTQVAIIPLQKEVTVIRFQDKNKSLLCGCLDGTIVMISLSLQIISKNEIPSQCYTYFTFHKSVIKDLTFLTYPDDQKLLFASVAVDGSFCLWKKQDTNSPAVVIDQGSSQPSSIIQINPNQLVQGGRDCTLKFFDIKKGHSYNYNQNNQIITKLYNLTSLIQYQKNKKQTHMDNSLRFISCQNSGKVVFWQGQKQFQHLTHKSRIASVDYINLNGGIFLVIEKQTAKMSFLSPVLFTHCLQDLND